VSLLRGMIPFEQVLARTLELVVEHSTDQSQSQVLSQAIGIQNGHKRPLAGQAASSFSLLVHSAIRGDEHPPIDLAAAITVHMLGRALLDDLVDGDLAPEFSGEDPAQLQLIGILLFTTMPQLFLFGMGTTPRIALECQRALLRATARMGAGQRLDLRSRTNREITLEAAYECVRLKSGAAVQMLAELGAILADAPESQRHHYAEFGNALGCQYSLTGDWRDLMRGAASDDLRNGTHNWPLALFFSALKGTERERFAAVLDDARMNPASREEVKARLAGSGVGQMLNFTIGSWGQRAMNPSEAARPLEPARSELFAYLQALPVAAGR
jgi:Polyprenyl synthetase